LRQARCPLNTSPRCRCSCIEQLPKLAVSSVGSISSRPSRPANMPDARRVAPSYSTCKSMMLPPRLPVIRSPSADSIDASSSYSSPR
jgi:hypothetical protein